MIDGIKIYYDLPNFLQWKEDTGIDCKVSIFVGTGHINQLNRKDKVTGLPYTSIEHRANFETYQLTVNEIAHTGKKTKYILTIEGSLHKNHFKGANFSWFTFPELCSEIKHLCLNLHLNANKCILKNFEYGFNLPVKFNPIEYLENNLISYKGKRFDRFKTESKKHIGYDCLISEYRIKIYDKSLQHDLKEPLMRFEKAYKKMTSPHKIGIFTLADFTKLHFLSHLQKELIQAWNDVLLFDVTVLSNINLSEKDRIFILECQNPKFFKGFKSGTTRRRKKDKFQTLLLKYGSLTNIHNEVKELLESEFNNSINLTGTWINGINKTGTFLPGAKNGAENQNRYTFTVNIEGKTLPPDIRYCKGCGKELHKNQKKSSSFCSAKYVGYNEAHRCRNLFYNPANNFNKKLIAINRNGLLFDINSFFQVKNISKYCN